MAKSKSEATPSYPNGHMKALEHPTLPEVRDPRGPLVYDLSSEWSDNGVQPDDKKKPGV